MSASHDPRRALRTERLLPFAPARVFAAFERADLLERWWGPKGFTSTFERFEFTPGGRWAFTMHAPNGMNYENETVFVEIVPDERIVLDHVVQPWFRLTVTLTARDAGTHLTWLQEFDSPEIAAKMRSLAATANEENLDRLHAVLADE